MQDWSDIAAILSALAAVAGLFFTGVQIQRNTHQLRSANYLEWLSRYLDFKTKVIDVPDLAHVTGETLIPKSTLTAEQEHFAYAQISFCEGLFLADQVNAFPDLEGASWETHILDVMTSPTIAALWEGHANDPDASPFATSYIRYVERLQS